MKCWRGLRRFTRITRTRRLDRLIVPIAKSSLPQVLHNPCRSEPDRDEGLTVTAKSKRPRNNLLHDFIGPRINPLHPRIGPRSGDRIFPHESVTAMQLHAFVEHLALQVSPPILGHRGGRHIQLALQVQLEAAINEDPADLDFSRYLRQLEARVLEIGNRLAERLA